MNLGSFTLEPVLAQMMLDHSRPFACRVEHVRTVLVRSGDQHEMLWLGRKPQDQDVARARAINAAQSPRVLVQHIDQSPPLRISFVVVDVFLLVHQAERNHWGNDHPDAVDPVDRPALMSPGAI